MQARLLWLFSALSLLHEPWTLNISLLHHTLPTTRCKERCLCISQLSSVPPTLNRGKVVSWKSGGGGEANNTLVVH
jgi:hypothetical protein